MSEKLPDSREDTVSDVEEEVTEPQMFKVLLHNDDYTTKEFVVTIIVSVFGKSLEEAIQLMWAVHKNGVGVCGVYPFEIAETKVNLVTATARENGFPLRSTMEPE
ncbi:MAG: ATP-dependent Clp protease adaptor ClpS [Desulfobacterales bacterium]